jgi:hypothetical protein
MTGNFKIKKIINNVQTYGVWLVHQDNVNKETRELYNIINTAHLISPLGCREMILRLFEKNKIREESSFLPNDKIEKLNVNDYVELGNTLKILKVKYNKKTDKLIQL